MVRGKEAKICSFDLHTQYSSQGTTAKLVSVSSQLAAGTSALTRIGGVVTVCAAGFTGTIVGGQSNLAIDEQYNTIRILFVRGNYALLNSNASNFTVSSIIGPSLVSGLRQVLYDKVFVNQSPGRDSTGYMPSVRTINWQTKLNLKLAFIGPAAATDYLESLVMIVVTDSVAVPHPGFEVGACWMSFLDD
jgi:hypothetical protein